SNKQLYLLAALNVLVFWGGILLSFRFFGLYSFPVFKFAAYVVSAAYYSVILVRFMEMGTFYFWRRYLGPALVPLGVEVIALWLFMFFLPDSKGTLNLLIVMSAGLTGVLLASIVYIAISRPFRREMISFYREGVVRTVGSLIGPRLAHSK
ncbi:MAG: hypothetical protein M1339_02710, partial [Bacteroidetes bacterium]|nr:hypothetical protein [Bacteroidota bacterium]